jgi:hypothetical protein
MESVKKAESSERRKDATQRTQRPEHRGHRSQQVTAKSQEKRDPSPSQADGIRCANAKEEAGLLGSG